MTVVSVRTLCIRTSLASAAFTRQAIRRASFTSVRQVTDAIRTFIDGWNERCVPFVWTKTAEDILAVANRKADSVTDH
jgi:hypothetical protein